MTQEVHILSLLSLRKLVAEQHGIVKDHNFISTLYMWWNYYSRHSIYHRQLDLAHWGVPEFIACFDNRLLNHVSAFVVCMPSHTSGGFLQHNFDLQYLLLVVKSDFESIFCVQCYHQVEIKLLCSYFIVDTANIIGSADIAHLSGLTAM